MYSQCRDFAKENGMPQLENFIHDGNFNGFVLTSGEEVELHKAFFSGQKYRIVVCKEENLPPVQFKVLNSELEVIFDNKTLEYNGVYDFELEESCKLIISLKFVAESKALMEDAKGCVALLFGIKM